jgi:hypothetical protein
VIYVKVENEVGRSCGWMEIRREDPLTPGRSEYTYQFRYNGGRGKGTVGGKGVRHQRAEDVFALIRAILNHSEQFNPEYCGGCHCEFQRVTKAELANMRQGERVEFYRKVEVG